MTLGVMSLALERIDAMLGLLKSQAEKGVNTQAAEDIARYQQSRDDLDVQIRVERIKQSTYRGRTRAAPHSGAVPLDSNTWSFKTSTVPTLVNSIR